MEKGKDSSFFMKELRLESKLLNQVCYSREISFSLEIHYLPMLWQREDLQFDSFFKEKSKFNLERILAYLKYCNNEILSHLIKGQQN